MKEQIIKWIQDNALDDFVSISEDTDLLDGSVLDSMGVISLIVYLQDECGVKADLSNLNIDAFRTVSSIVKMIGENVQ